MAQVNGDVDTAIEHADGAGNVVQNVGLNPSNFEQLVDGDGKPRRPSTSMTAGVVSPWQSHG